MAHLPTTTTSKNNMYSFAHVSDQLPSEGHVSPIFMETSTVEDEAALLLSISSICAREVKTTGVDAMFEDEMPRFPMLSGIPSTSQDISTLKPRSEPLFSFKNNPSFQAIRARSVSIDSPGLAGMVEGTRITSPVSLPNASKTSEMGVALISPITPHSVRRLPTRKQSQRIMRQARQDSGLRENVMEEELERAPAAISSKDKKGRTLQASPPKGIPIKKIGRKKFSWKCYPELEQFLITNREEYLRHSALNYTVQQKQYNNRLTDELLELATKHGYLFDTQEFSFVTVRDRIRCYYKSYVQSAKKRGVLMGYAARKAGLLKEDDLLAATV